jgi:hypothetical protein
MWPAGHDGGAPPKRNAPVKQRSTATAILSLAGEFEVSGQGGAACRKAQCLGSIVGRSLQSLNVRHLVVLIVDDSSFNSCPRARLAMARVHLPVAMTTNRTLIFGLVCFMIGVWVGRVTAHRPVLWDLLGG